MDLNSKIKNFKRYHDLKVILRVEETAKKKQKDKNKNCSDKESKEKFKIKLSNIAQRKYKNYKAKEHLQSLIEKKKDNIPSINRISSKILKSSSSNFSNNEIDGSDILKGAILLYGISEGATGTIQDFDKILEALKSDTFLSREFNALRELNEYKLNPDGTPKYTGGGRGNVKPEDVAKAAKKFKLNAKLIKGARNLGKAANGVGLIFTTLESLEDGEITVLEAMDILMGVVAFVPGYGWIISGTWSLLRLTVPTNAGNYGIEMGNGIRRFGEW